MEILPIDNRIRSVNQTNQLQNLHTVLRQFLFVCYKEMDNEHKLSHKVKKRIKEVKRKARPGEKM